MFQTMVYPTPNICVHSAPIHCINFFIVRKRERNLNNEEHGVLAEAGLRQAEVAKVMKDRSCLKMRALLAFLPVICLVAARLPLPPLHPGLRCFFEKIFEEKVRYLIRQDP